jgi:ADP-ribose pyrophosphatase YjhB (NUDIX family)
MSHIHERIDFTVEVFIVHKNRVLLRMHDKYKKWMSVGGHIELHEDPIEAAYREVKEEVGLDVELVGNPEIKGLLDRSKELIPPVALNRHPSEKPGHEHVTFVYFARVNSQTNLSGQARAHLQAKLAVMPVIRAMYQDDKSEECKWCSREEIERMDLWPNIRKYALAALDRLAG